MLLCALLFCVIVNCALIGNASFFSNTYSVSNPCVGIPDCLDITISKAHLSVILTIRGNPESICYIKIILGATPLIPSVKLTFGVNIFHSPTTFIYHAAITIII